MSARIVKKKVLVMKCESCGEKKVVDKFSYRTKQNKDCKACDECLNYYSLDWYNFQMNEEFYLRYIRSELGDYYMSMIDTIYSQHKYGFEIKCLFRYDDNEDLVLLFEDIDGDGFRFMIMNGTSNELKEIMEKWISYENYVYYDLKEILLILNNTCMYYNWEAMKELYDLLSIK